jgi:hypothetical protein
MCGSSREEALAGLIRLERLTRPDRETDALAIRASSLGKTQ